MFVGFFGVLFKAFWTTLRKEETFWVGNPKRNVLVEVKGIYMALIVAFNKLSAFALGSKLG
jgi:hypothetical protein